MALSKPVLLFDGHCGFCRIWIDYWRKLTGDRIEYASFQEATRQEATRQEATRQEATRQEGGPRFPQISEEDFRQAVQLARPDGSVASGARAVFESLGWERAYRFVGRPAEAIYRFIAGRRDFFYQATRFTFGTKIEPARFSATSWLFVRALALVYLIAFSSLAMQVGGLFGEQGILPVRTFLANVARTGGGLRFVAVPSLFWLASEDNTLLGMALMGGALSLILLMLSGFRNGKFQRLLFFQLYAVYLSFAAVGQEFMGFQWDSLLLEAGFLAIFLNPSATTAWGRPRDKIVPWLFRWLGFRLIFLSGAVKLLSEDPFWRNLSALGFHWHTQPLPTVLAWYADKLPARANHMATWMTLFIELVVPFCVFMPRRIRQAGAWILIAFQGLIMLTGNYTFFNILTIALLLFWFDDQALLRFVPALARGKWVAGPRWNQFSYAATVGIAAAVLVLSLSHMFSTFTGRLPAPLATALRYSGSLEVVNTYGLFAEMTTRRLEIITEGSEDGEHWQAYEFPYKPGEVNRMPGWVAPHQPRLDWQMWFAALGSYRENIWYVNFAVRLLQGSQPVLRLLAYDPFAGHPPKFIRGSVYEYNFTDWETHRRTGAWWTRKPLGLYLPSVALRTNPGR